MKPEKFLHSEKIQHIFSKQNWTLLETPASYILVQEPPKKAKPCTRVHCGVKKCIYNRNYKCTRETIHINFTDKYHGTCQEMKLRGELK